MQFKWGSFLCIYYCLKSHHRWLSKRFRKSCFSRRCFFFRKANFRLLTSFSQSLTIYRSVTNPTNNRVFRLKLRGGAQKIFLLIPWTKILHQIRFLTRTIYQKIWKILAFGMFNINLNFSTEWIQSQLIYNLMFLIALYSPKNDNKQPSEMRN